MAEYGLSHWNVYPAVPGNVFWDCQSGQVVDSMFQDFYILADILCTYSVNYQQRGVVVSSCGRFVYFSFSVLSIFAYVFLMCYKACVHI